MHEKNLHKTIRKSKQLSKTIGGAVARRQLSVWKNDNFYTQWLDLVNDTFLLKQDFHLK